MNGRFYRIISVLVTLAISLLSLAYLTKTIFDVGCAMTSPPEEGLKRKFLGVNCWLWERAILFQENRKI